VADLVLLMVDASFGFEMETFEFLNMLQVRRCPSLIRHVSSILLQCAASNV
jgi:ribosome biogenesis protein BMS1